MNLADLQSAETQLPPRLNPVTANTTVPQRTPITDIGSGHILYVGSAMSTVTRTPIEKFAMYGANTAGLTVGYGPQQGETAKFRAPSDLMFMWEVKRSSIQVLHGRQERNRAAATLLRSWLNADAESKKEQSETLKYLVKALDDDRLSDRKRFR